MWIIKHHWRHNLQSNLNLNSMTFYTEKCIWTLRLQTGSHLLRPQLLLVIYHYNDVIMSAIASQITSLTIVYSIVHSDADQRKHQRSTSLAFVREIRRGPVNSPHKCPVTRKMFPFDGVIMNETVLHFNNWAAVVITAPWKQVWSRGWVYNPNFPIR